MLPWTARTRSVLRLAQGQAEATGHGYVGTGHIFVGLLSEGEGVAARVLGSLGFEGAEVIAQVSGLRGAREERAAAGSWLSRPAKMAIECALQEACILGHRRADTEHVLLGLLRTGRPFRDTAFMRIVGFEDQLRIRNETLRVVARPPSAGEVALRRAREAAGPQSEFEACALGLLLDSLKNIPAAEVSAIKGLALRLSFEQGTHEQPVIEARWDTSNDVASAETRGSYSVRIPPSGSEGQVGAELRRTWLNDASRSPRRVDGVLSPEWEAEIEHALALFGRRLATLFHKSNLLWELVGHGIPIIVQPLAAHRTIEP